MATLKIEVLKNLIQNLPDDYTIEYKNNDDIISPISDTIEIDASGKKVILKK